MSSKIDAQMDFKIIDSATLLGFVGRGIPPTSSSCTSDLQRTLDIIFDLEADE